MHISKAYGEISKKIQMFRYDNTNVEFQMRQLNEIILNNSVSSDTHNTTGNQSNINNFGKVLLWGALGVAGIFLINQILQVRERN